jgi:hypothetical protein
VDGGSLDAVNPASLARGPCVPERQSALHARLPESPIVGHASEVRRRWKQNTSPPPRRRLSAGYLWVVLVAGVALSGCATGDGVAGATSLVLATDGTSVVHASSDNPVALRTCPIGTDKPVGQNAWGLNCVVALYLTEETHVEMQCWVSTFAPSDGPSQKWFRVRVIDGPANGEDGWIWADLVDEQTVTPECDHIGHENDPPPTPVSLSDLVFTVVGTCTTTDGTLHANSAGFSPGGEFSVAAWYPDGSPYRDLKSSGTVRADGSVPWEWSCAGDPAGTYGTSLVDLETGRYVEAAFQIEAAPRTPPESVPGPSETQGASPQPDPKPSRTPAPTASPKPKPTPPQTVTLTVYNKVTNGGTEMREDDAPAYLSTVTKNYCRRDGCMVAGTEMNTGATLTGLCWVSGDRTTNGEDGDPVDDSNPGLYSSTRWYFARHPNGSTGYISEVWIEPSQRGGAGLPAC